MLKRYCSILVSGLLLICLSACGNKISPPPESSGEASPPLLKDVVPLPIPDEGSESDIIDPAEEAARLSAPSADGGTLPLNVEPTPPLSETPAAPASPAPSAVQEEEIASAGEEQLMETRPEVLILAGGDEEDQVIPSEMELELVRLINREREAGGLNALGLEETLSWAASIRAPEAMESLTHTRPDGQPYYTVFDEVGFTYAGKWHGENITYMYFELGAYDAAGAARAMFNRLKESSYQYQNMLSENFHQIGVSIYIQNDGKTVRISSAQLFASI